MRLNMTNTLLPQNLTNFLQIAAARIKQITLVDRDFDTKPRSFNKRINSNKTKHLAVKNELKKEKTFDLSYVRGKNHFEEDGTQNYLVFPPMHRYLKDIGNIDHVGEWKFKRLSDEVIKPLTLSVFPTLSYYGTKPKV